MLFSSLKTQCGVCVWVCVIVHCDVTLFSAMSPQPLDVTVLGSGWDMIGVVADSSPCGKCPLEFQPAVWCSFLAQQHSESTVMSESITGNVCPWWGNDCDVMTTLWELTSSVISLMTVRSSREREGCVKIFTLLDFFHLKLKAYHYYWFYFGRYCNYDYIWSCILSWNSHFCN